MGVKIASASMAVDAGIGVSTLSEILSGKFGLR
jgi:hypothetical protein